MIISAQKTKLFSFDNGIAPICRIKLAVKVFQVGSDGFPGDTESVGDLLVAQALFQKQQHLVFAIGQNFSPVDSAFSRRVFIPSEFLKCKLPGRDI